MNKEDLIKLAKSNPNISDDEIDEDINETVKEISIYKNKLWEYKWRFDITYQNQITQREDFIETLENLKKGRELLKNKKKINKY